MSKNRVRLTEYRLQKAVHDCIDMSQEENRNIRGVSSALPLACVGVVSVGVMLCLTVTLCHADISACLFVNTRWCQSRASNYNLCYNGHL